eukprot:140449-Chlamydomonas_euryale.AAC.12
MTRPRCPGAPITHSVVCAFKSTPQCPTAYCHRRTPLSCTGDMLCTRSWTALPAPPSWRRRCAAAHNHGRPPPSSIPYIGSVLLHTITDGPPSSIPYAGDVLLHTVTDAILGALSLPDIGQLFPDNDPKWKGCNSDVFLKEAVRLMEERGFVLGNIDCTIIAQKPKISPHKLAIRTNLCALLNADMSAVNVKVGILGGRVRRAPACCAFEPLVRLRTCRACWVARQLAARCVDSIGEERAIACHAVVMLMRRDLAPSRKDPASSTADGSISSGYNLDLH